MKKSDLKTGMRVKTREGEVYLVVKDIKSVYYGRQDIALIREGGFILGSNYNENLLNKNKENDIMKVYTPSAEYENGLLRKDTLNLDVRYLIWERKEYTTRQIEIFEALKVLEYEYIAKDHIGTKSIYAHKGKPVKITVPKGYFFESDTSWYRCQMPEIVEIFENDRDIIKIP